VQESLATELVDTQIILFVTLDDLELLVRVGYDGPESGFLGADATVAGGDFCDFGDGEGVDEGATVAIAAIGLCESSVFGHCGEYLYNNVRLIV
jgi:hypothetical protein